MAKGKKELTNDELNSEAIKLIASPIVLFGAELNKMIHYVPLQHVDTKEKALSCVLQDGHVQWTPLKGNVEDWKPLNDNVSDMYGQVQIYGEKAEMALNAITARSKLSVYALAGFTEEAAEILNVKECVKTLANAIDASNSFEKKKPAGPAPGKSK